MARPHPLKAAKIRNLVSFPFFFPQAALNYHLSGSGQMSALTEDEASVPPFGKSYMASPLAHSLDCLAATPITTPGLTARTSPGSRNEDVGSNPPILCLRE